MTGARTGGLERGTEARQERAALKRRITTADVDLAALLRGQAPEADEITAMPMRIGDLLQAVDGVGPITASMILNHAGLLETTSRTRLNALTVRARRDIARQLTHHVQGDRT